MNEHKKKRVWAEVKVKAEVVAKITRMFFRYIIKNIPSKLKLLYKTIVRTLRL